MKKGPIHILHRAGYTTLCGKDSARTRWSGKPDCKKCIELAEAKK